MNKSAFLILLFLLNSIVLFSQVAINIDGTSPNNAAMLDVKSVDKGVLLPRMTANQMNSISSPPNGLIVYNTTVNALFWFDGSSWRQFNEFNFSETDPIFGAHPSSGISALDISNWNNAFGWGNHATLGYLTSFTESDPIFSVHPSSGITSGSISNWNTAYTNRILSVEGTAPLYLSISSNQLTGSITISNSTTSGYLTSTDWNTFNTKQNALIFGNVFSSDLTISGGTAAVIGSGLGLTINKGNLTETTSSVLTLTGGTNAVLGTGGTTIQVKQANNSQSGYLSSADWNIFNNKVSSQWITSGQDIYYSSGKVGIGTSTPAASAILDVNSTNSGVLIPRVTKGQRDGINSPAEGLMVYCTNCGTEGSLSIYSNGAWRTFAPCINNAPSAGTNTLTPGQIIWGWSAAAGATGYKWHTDATYEMATEIGDLLYKTETGTECDTTYQRYVWAYNGCGISEPLILSQSISANSPATPISGTHVVTQTSVVWIWNTITGATGYKWNSINDYETATDLGTDSTKSETNLTCGTEYTRFVWAYNGCGYSAPLTMTQSTLACWICGDPFTVTHTAGNVAPVDKIVTYGTVNNIPGETTKCWITSNLGADHQATAKTDNTEESAGWYWQFNRQQGFKHTGSVRTPNTTWISSINENSDWLTTNDPCALLLGSNWRLPTNTEWSNVDASGGWTDWNGPWDSALKIHTAGFLSYTAGSLDYRGSYGRYWSITQSSNSNGWALGFYAIICGPGNSYNKALGLSARCLQD